MNVNIPLLRKSVEWVEEQAQLPPERSQWNQAEWVSTPKDMAIRLYENQFRRRPERHNLEEYYSFIERVEPSCGTAYCVAGYIGQMLDARYAQSETVDGVHVSDFAAKALGIDADAMDRLFEGDNTAEDIRYIAEEIAGERL